MKLEVHGVEEILITDPKGACNPPAPQPGQPSLPARPTPQVVLPAIPGTGGGDPNWPGVAVPNKTPIYTRHAHDPNNPLQPGKWGVGGPMIQQAAQQVDPDKWEKNWQAKMTGGEDRIDGNRYTS